MVLVEFGELLVLHAHVFVQLPLQLEQLVRVQRAGYARVHGVRVFGGEPCLEHLPQLRVVQAGLCLGAFRRALRPAALL